MRLNTLLEIEELDARGCKGANCGRKGKGRNAKPLRSTRTKQEEDSLTSKALKIRLRKKKRSSY